jgi:hypothetical protein
MKRKVFITFVGLIILSFLVLGVTPNEKSDAERISLERRIKALENEIIELKGLLKKNPLESLKEDVVQDESKIPMGPRLWTEGTRGWEEDGMNMWTAVGALPSYNVGIGTNTPWVKLEVAGHIRADRGPLTNIEVFADCSNNPAWDYAGIALSNGTFFPATRLQTFGPSHSPANAFHLRHYPDAPIIISTNDTERMRIAGDGNVGVGETNPQYLLDVAGDLRITGGIHDGGVLGFGNANNVLVADGVGGVAWGPSPAGDSGDYIWNQSAVVQTPGDFWIDGVGQAGDGINVTGLIAGVGNSGVYGQSNDNTGAGVFGNGMTITTGVYGTTDEDSAYGVWGYNANGSGTGVVGAGNGATSTYLTGGSGVAGSGSNVGVFGYGDATNGSYGVYAVSDAADAAGFGVRAHNSVLGGCGIFGTGNGVGTGTYWGGSGVSGSSDDVGIFGYGDATMYSWAMLGLCDADTGIGVYGYASAPGGFGVRAHSDNAAGNGLVASGNGIGGTYLTGGSGVCGSSSNVGVYARGDATAGSQGIYTRSLASDGNGIQSAGNGLTPWTFGSGGGIEGTGSVRGITGFSDLGVANGMGMYGYSLDNSGGVGGAGVLGRHIADWGTGVIGMAANTNNWYVTLFAGSGGAFTAESIGVAAYSVAPIGVTDVAGGYFENFNDNVAGGTYAYVALDQAGGTAYKINGPGLVSTIMETREGKKNLFAPESPEPWFEDFGEGQLVNGTSGKISLDPKFHDCITVDRDNPLKVFVQLRDNCNGVYVKTYDDGFEVIELNDGNSNAQFTYRVVGKWKGNENLRFPDAPGRLARNVVDVSRDKIVKARIEEREVDDSRTSMNLKKERERESLTKKVNNILKSSLKKINLEKKGSSR